MPRTAPTRLTDKTCNRPAPESGRLELRDAACPGLELRIAKSRGTTTRSWMVDYTADGRRGRMVMGRYPDMTLIEARERAGAVRSAARRGEDPREAKRATAKTVSVADLLDRFEKTRRGLQVNSYRVMQGLRRNLKPWLKRKADSIERMELVELCSGIAIGEGPRRKGPAPVMAVRIARDAGTVWAWAVDAGLVKVNPFAGLKKATLGVPPERPRDRVLSDDELRWVFAQPGTMADVLRMVLLTGSRPGEVTAMQREQVVDGAWHYTVSKTGRTHTVRMPLMALDILKHRPGANRPDGPVFASPKRRGGVQVPVGVGGCTGWLTREGVTFRPHDCRRTVRTRLAELGVDVLTAESVLGHVLPGMLGVYDHSDRSVPAGAALAKWETALREVLAGC